MDLNKISDLQLGQVLFEQQKLLYQTAENVRLLEAEMKKRLEEQNKNGDVRTQEPQQA